MTDQPAAPISESETPPIEPTCECGHLERIHDENGCRGVYNDFFRAGLSCTCKKIRSDTPPPQDSLAAIREILAENGISSWPKHGCNCAPCINGRTILDSFSRLTRERDEARDADAFRLTKVRQFQAEIKTLEAEVSRLTDELDDWRNREAAVCPEDVGFEEFLRCQGSWVTTLERECDRLTAELSELRKNTLTPKELKICEAAINTFFGKLSATALNYNAKLRLLAASPTENKNG